MEVCQCRLVADFDETMWYALVDRVAVEDKNMVRYFFENGVDITA